MSFKPRETGVKQSFSERLNLSRKELRLLPRSFYKRCKMICSCMLHRARILRRESAIRITDSKFLQLLNRPLNSLCSANLSKHRTRREARGHRRDLYMARNALMNVKTMPGSQGRHSSCARNVPHLRPALPALMIYQKTN